MLCCALGLVSIGAGAQQLMNPGFDTNLQPWVDPGYPDRALSWNSEDAAGSSTSGSLLHVSGYTSGGTGYALWQCVDADPSTSYRVGGKSYVPSGQSADAAGWVGVIEYEQDNCVTANGHNWYVGPTPVTGAWQAFNEIEVTTLSSTQSIAIELGTWVDVGGVDVQVFFDDIYIGGQTLFDDGFESGDTTAWSSTSP